MALKIRFAKPTTQRGWGSLIVRAALACVALVLILFLAVFGYYYFRYQGIVDARLQQPLFETTAKIYAAPREVRPGQKLNRAAIVNELRSAGYTVDGSANASPLGTFSQSDNGVSVHPGPLQQRRRRIAHGRSRAGAIEL
jgi:penicillin-binding protein 1B